MLSSQLGRAVLSGSVLTHDQQEAATDERGGYGELMDLIDRVIDESGESEGESLNQTCSESPRTRRG
jgi:hypothetical protein